MEQNYEKYVKRLEEIVEILEDGGLSLEESLKLFRRLSLYRIRPL